MSGNFLYSQEVSISGKVTDTSGQPIENINVLVESIERNSIVVFDFTNPKGFYLLELEQPGNYYLEFRGMGYETLRIDISEEFKTTKHLRKDIKLKIKNEVLKEVLIDAESNIQIKKDTITILANSFLTGKEDVLEDLFENIPGLSVGKDGTIKVGNRSIEKVMVEGDDFFGRGYKLLTKNMDPNSIEKVEIYHNYSSNKLLKDIENSDKVALNVTLKEDKKYEWFGNLTVGYNALLKDRHIGRLNLMSFGKKNKFYFLSTLNNLGIDTKGSLKDLTKTSEDELVSSLGKDVETFSYYHGNNRYIPYFEETRIKFNNSKLVSLNGIFNLNEKLKMKLLAFSYWDEKDFILSNIRRYQLENSEMKIEEFSQSKNQDFDSFFKMQLDYDISSVSSLKFVSVLSHSSFDSFSNFSFNSKNSDQKTNENTILLDQSISYTYKIGDKEVLDVSGRIIEEGAPQSLSTNDTLLQSFFSDESSAGNIIQKIEQTVDFKGVETNYFNRISERNLFQLKSGYTNTTSHLDTFIQGISEGDENFANNVLYKTQNLYLIPSYSTTWKKLTFSGALGLTNYFTTLSSNNRKERNKILAINPQVSLKWQINGTNKILTQYSRSLNFLDLPNIAPSYILEDYRTITRGTTSHFNPLAASNVLLNFSSGSWGDRFFANIYINYTRRNDYLSSKSVITSEVEKVEKIIFENQDLLNISSSLDQYLKFLSSNLKLKAGYSSTAFKSVVNNTLRDVKADNYSLGFEFKTAFSSPFNFHLGSEWMKSEISSTGSFGTSRNFSFLDLMYTPKTKLTFSLRTEAYHQDNSFSNSEPIFFLNFDARYSIIKNKLSLQLHGQNLTNTKSYTDSFVNEISSVETSYKLIPRYILLKIDYRF